MCEVGASPRGPLPPAPPSGPRELVAPHVTFTPQSSQLRLDHAPRCSAFPTAAVRSFSSKPFRSFSPLSIAMACCHNFLSLELSSFPHSGAMHNPAASTAFETGCSPRHDGGSCVYYGARSRPGSTC